MTMIFSRECKFSFVALLFLLFLVPVHALHGQSPHLRRRPLALNKGVHRRVDVGSALASVPSALSDILNVDHSPSDPGGTPTDNSPPSSHPTSPTHPSTAGDPSISDPPQNTPPSSGPTSATNPPSTPTPNDGPSSPPPSSPVTPTPSNSAAVTPAQLTSPPSSPSPSQSVSCPLGLDLAGNCVLPAVSHPASRPSDTPDTPSDRPSDTPDRPSRIPDTPSSSDPPQSNLVQTPTPVPSSPTSVPQSSPSDTPTPSPVLCLSPLILVNGVCVQPPSSDSPSTPTGSSLPQQLTPSSSQPPPSNTPTPSPVLCLSPLILVNGVCVQPPSSNSPSPSTPVESPLPQQSSPPSSSQPPPSNTPTPSPVLCLSPLILVNGVCVQPPSSDQSSTPTRSSLPQQPSAPSSLQPSPSNSPTPSPVLCLPPSVIVDGICIAHQSPVSSSVSDQHFPPVTSETPSQSSSPISTPSSPVIDPCGPVGQSRGLCSSLSSLPPTSTPGSTPSNSDSPSPFPSGSSTDSGSSSPPTIQFPSGSPSRTESVPSTVPTTPSSPTFTPPPNTQFSYVTQTSLLGAAVPSSPIPLTLTNPDAPPTTTPSNTASGHALPSNLPARIYPANPLDQSTVTSGYTFCSLLFTATLRWNFIARYSQAQGQIFAWTPVAIAQALGIDPSDAPAFAMQVFIPEDYQDPQDVDKLLTEYLFYLRDDQVPVLADQLKAKSSHFYKVDQPYRQISDQVDASFALTSVSNPNAIPGSPSAATAGGNKSRTSTIIGVVSALGGVTIIILGALIFKGIKRSRELRHHRLSDPNVPNDPYPDRTGRDFDQDSIGGQRRRSFYFAEDSLRGQQQTVDQYVVAPGSQIQHSQRISPESMRERRAPVVPASISAPVLTQSSLNW